MTPQEKDLVAQLLQRLKQVDAQTKDPEAEAMIRRAVAEQPDAAYYLVQTVLMQDMALGQAQTRLAELERQGNPTPAQPRSFLGGSVPSAGPWGRAPQAPLQRGGWNTQPAAGSSFLRNAAATAMGVAGGALLFQGLSSMFGSAFGGQAQPGLGESAGAPPPAEEQLAASEPPAEEGWDSGQDVAAGDWGGGGDDLA